MRRSEPIRSGSNPRRHNGRQSPISNVLQHCHKRATSAAAALPCTPMVRDGDRWQSRCQREGCWRWRIPSQTARDLWGGHSAGTTRRGPSEHWGSAKRSSARAGRGALGIRESSTRVGRGGQDCRSSCQRLHGSTSPSRSRCVQEKISLTTSIKRSVRRSTRKARHCQKYRN